MSFKRNRKKRAFTLIEVIVALALFSTGLMGYMSFQNYASSVTFDAGTSETGNQIAMDLISTVSSMTPVAFHNLAQSIDRDRYYKDYQLSAYIQGLRDADGDLSNAGPFDHRGVPLNGSETGHYIFYRFLRIQPYVIETNNVGLYGPGSAYRDLWHMDVIVVWPRKHNHDTACDTANPDPTLCHRIQIPLVKNEEAP